MAFTLDRVPGISQGEGALDRVGALAAALGGGGSVLLVADPGLGAFGIIAKAETSLRAAGLSIATFSDIKSDPSVAQVDAAAALARRERATVVVALGGGSAMDAGKAAAAVAPAVESATQYALCANPFPPGALPIICVPTTSGTGSETTRTSVLSDASGAKVWLWGDELKPARVILDPVLTVGLPTPMTAATGIDVLVHAIEASTNARANFCIDLFCHEAIRLAARFLPAAVERPDNLEARAAIQWAAALAGIGIDNAGTAIAHNIGHALASLRPIHHGRAVGVAMLATLPWNIAGPSGCRFGAAAEAMGGARDAAALPGLFEALLRRVGVKIPLGDEGFDVTPEQLAVQMARPENAAMRDSNRRPVGDDALLVFARTVLEQV